MIYFEADAELGVPSHLNADRWGESCHNWLTDVLDEEAEVEDPAEDLDDPREESESDSLGGWAWIIKEKES